MEFQPDKSSPGPRKIEGNFYTQVNILFPSEQVELPPAEKFKAFPPEAQKAILTAFEREQIERHAWLKNQQAHDHALNMQSGKHYFRWRMFGTGVGFVLVLATLGLGAWLVKCGASAVGVSMMLAAAAGLVGTAVYGHKVNAQTKAKEEESQSPAGAETQSTLSKS